MEHEVAVPFPLDEVQQVLADPGRLRRCVPGLQVNAGDTSGTEAAAGGAAAGRDKVSGRLRLRVGGSTITYRGVLRVSAGDGEYRIEAEGDEVRGTGTVKATLVVTLEAADGATVLRLSGRAVAGGRLAAAGPTVAAAAGRRLLDRFAAELSTELAAGAEPGKAAPEEVAPEEDASGDDAPVVPPLPAQSARPAEGDRPSAEVADEAAETEPSAEPVAEPGAEPEPVAETPEVPETSDAPDTPDTADAQDTPDAPRVPAEPEEQLTSPVSPAAGRRTMIGRSAEEVDHAPPRGRYAPVAVPENGSTGAFLRWAAPAAAALVASAVVVSRILRRRR